MTTVVTAPPPETRVLHQVAVSHIRSILITPLENLLRTQTIFFHPFRSALFVASVFAVLFSCHTADAATPDSPIAGQRWWSYVQHLASDRMEGRLTGSDGSRRAAQYVTEQFQASSLVPKGVNGCLQPVRFNVQRIQSAP